MITWEWNRTAIRRPMGIRLVRDPLCRMVLDDQSVCGLPATVRVTRGTDWSLMWCPVHAAAWTLPWAEYLRRFPDNGKRLVRA